MVVSGKSSEIPMRLSAYQKFCYLTFKKPSEKFVDDELRRDLLTARIEIKPEVYVSFVWMSSILVFIVSFIFILPILTSVPLTLASVMFVILCPLFLSTVTYVGFMRVPKTVSKLRAKDIDNRLPYAANFISAMAVGGINPDVIFERISRQKVFGEIQREFQYIYRDIAYYGDDVVTAVRKGIARSPSLKFRDFLQGIVTTITSGGELKPYFASKAEDYMNTNKIEYRETLNSLGILGESYVTIVIAAPLLFIVMFVVVSMAVPDFSHIALILTYFIILALIPIFHILFIYFVRSTVKEV